MTEKKPWQKTKEEVLKKLGVNPQLGLSEVEVVVRQKKFGPNQLPEEKPLTAFFAFLNQFKSPLVYILVIAGGATLILKQLTDTIVIFAAVFINTIVGFFQEYKASKALTALKKVLKIKAIVFRAGDEKEIPQEELVPGDIFLLKSGDKVPADGRLIEANNLKINESVLTGEWLPAEKKTISLKAETALADRDNLAFMGTVVEDGRGKAVVTQVGEETEIGKIAQLVKEAEEERTPYQKKLVRFSQILAGILVIICFGIFIEGVISGKKREEMFSTSVAVAVAAIPEGLPVAMTVILALGMQRVLKRKGLVRKLASAETLGSTSVILTDKTGTLTEAKMKVAEIFPEKNRLLALKIAFLTSQAFVENQGEALGKWVIRGGPTEKALLLAGVETGFLEKWSKIKQDKVDELPFNPVNRYSTALYPENILYLKGAPEKILTMAKYFKLNGRQEKITPQKQAELEKKTADLAAKGQRVLAVAYKRVQGSRFKVQGADFKNLVFVGLIALTDPLRKEAKEAIRTCFGAGLRPILVTGDHKLTAKAIAQEIGLPVEKENVIEGRDLDQMSEVEFQKKLAEITVYARVEPAQKLRIVRAWQERGEVVAMTGDGINDAPALKRADIGVALGSGTEVAKEVSDLVLLDDNFSVIVAAIEQGRAIIDNARKVITYLLSGSFTEVILVGASVLFGLPLPISAAQILWVNLIEDSLPSIALSFEPKEKDLMRRKPEAKNIPLLTKEMKTIIFVIGLVTDLFLLGLTFWLFWAGHPLKFVRTMVFVGLAIDSLFYVFSCKSLRKNLWQINLLSNKFLNLAWLVGIAMLLLALYSPPLQVVLKTVPLNYKSWLILLGLGGIKLFLIELTKWYFISQVSVRKSRES